MPLALLTFDCESSANLARESRTGTYCCLSDWPSYLARLVTMTTSNQCMSTDVPPDVPPGAASRFRQRYDSSSEPRER